MCLFIQLSSKKLGSENFKPKMVFHSKTRLANRHIIDTQFYMPKIKVVKKTRLIIDTIIIGLVGAAAAQIFVYLLKLVGDYSLKLIAGYTPPDVIEILKQTNAVQAHHPLLIILVLVIGGLISGILVYSFAPEAEGHGTDTAVRAFHRTGGYIRPIVTPIKIISSAITIGTGGSAGREGPTALFSSGVGSIYANIKKATTDERRLYVLVGMASGLSAIFRAPIGTSIFAISVLYSGVEFESWALVYTLLGSLVAYIATGFTLGWHPIFFVPGNLFVSEPKTYVHLILLGIVCGIIGLILPNIFYYTRDIFHKIKIPPHIKPALGALLVGIIAIKLPQVLGGGYGWIQDAIDGKLAFDLMALLVFGKILAFSFTVSSGGSGGVFAPSLFIGVMTGGMVAGLFHDSVAVFTIIGMAAVFGAAARAPIATVIMVMEMTGGYKILAPTSLVVLLSYLIQVELSRLLKVKYNTLYEAQVPDKSYSPVHQIETLRNIIACHTRTISMPIDKIKDREILDLLESGIPIELGNGKMLFFGTLIKPIKAKKYGNELVYKDAKIIYIFRDGKWLHPVEVNELKVGDEILILGTERSFTEIEPALKSVSDVFSKLKQQYQRKFKHAGKRFNTA